MALNPYRPAVRAIQMSLLSFALAQASVAAVNPVCNSVMGGKGGALPMIAEVQAGLEEWGTAHISLARSRIENKFAGSAGKVAGASQAAPRDPRGEYIDLWIRDNGICVREVSDHAQIIHDYLEFSKMNYRTKTRGDLGEPKFRPDGSAFNGDWGRPQNDGPAYRSLRAMEEIDRQLKLGKVDAALAIYHPDIRVASVKWDLEYLAHQWSKPGFELWEEEEGVHFHTLMMIQNALEKGSQIAAKIEPVGFRSTAANYYRDQANQIREYLLKNSWDAQRQYIKSIYQHTGGFVNKAEPLDISVILAVIHTSETEGTTQVFRVTDDQVMATMKRIEERFSEIYRFNERFVGVERRGAVALGRYPGDIFHGGNPWVISIHGAAEYYYKFAAEIQRSSALRITDTNRGFYSRLLQRPVDQFRPGMMLSGNSDLKAEVVRAAYEKGDAFLGIVRELTPADGYHTEQIGRGYRPGDQGAWVKNYLEQTAWIGDANVARTGGEWIGAVDLTWNDASFLSAWRAREALKKTLK